MVDRLQRAGFSSKCWPKRKKKVFYYSHYQVVILVLRRLILCNLSKVNAADPKVELMFVTFHAIHLPAASTHPSHPSIHVWGLWTDQKTKDRQMDGHEHYLTRTPRAKTKIQNNSKWRRRKTGSMPFLRDQRFVAWDAREGRQTDGRQEKLLNVIKLIALKSLW